ncbi:MAG: 5-bromo-4-chloroindolyl phosphate hydrolysis family protein [Exiguobacterium marinum]|uniref:5-bromo-4-chloroindolyl phosphate hydrolysis family protein n=1 Tax=Exiguobacterium marinum TaxID=273528 RepID=A0ABY7X213_9BACL|nr:MULTISPECIES: 5-bromo-4-chloroindolyl phosphate hydrolysis family protein [Exiguobacterium]WDH77127.1 5-bromo-4-chloroindolyl phosphate hydrolysis family protein [Exiguobacterium marinum]
MKTWMKWALTGAVIYFAINVFDFSWLFIIVGALVLNEVWSTNKRKNRQRTPTTVAKRAKKKLLLDEEESFSGSRILKPIEDPIPARQFEATDDLELQFLQRTIEQGYEKLQQIDRVLPEIKDVEVRREMKAVSKEAHELFEELFENPQDAKHVRDLFTFYLDSLVSVVLKFKELEGKRVIIQEETREQLITNMRLIVDKFKEQRGRLLEDDAVDFERELIMMERVLSDQPEGRKKHDFIE